MPSTKNHQDRREADQLERLFDLLPDSLFATVKQLPYAQRAQVERWFLAEANRVSSVMARTVGGAQHASPAVTELLDILAADPIDLQAAGGWLTSHRDEITPMLMAELVSAAMGRGVMDLMSARADKRQGGNRDKKAAALKLWQDEFAAKDLSKERAAQLIAPRVGLAAGTVRRYLRGLEPVDAA